METRGRRIPGALPAMLAALLAVACLLAWDFPPARAWGATAAPLLLNAHARVEMEAGDGRLWRFVPDADGTYIFRGFPEAGADTPEVLVRLIRERDGEALIDGRQEAGLRVSGALKAGEGYLLELTALTRGTMAVEVMLSARGRCYDNPIALSGESVRYAKTIVHSYDVHWFAFIAPASGRYLIRTERTGEEALDTYGYLMNAAGEVLAEGDDLLDKGDPNFMIERELAAGDAYYVRISAFGGQTGAYRLVVTAPDGDKGPPETIFLPRHDLVMDVEEEYTLEAAALPGGSLDELVYASSDGAVVTVEPDGRMRAVSAGEAEVWVFSYGGLKERCLVTVRPVEVTGLSLARSGISLYVEEETRLRPRFEPENASDRRVRYESSDETVATVDGQGLVVGVGTGEARITVISRDGDFRAWVQVTVKGIRPAYRALVIGEQMYPDGVRTGGVNTAQGVADMLARQNIGGAGYQVRLQLDSTLQELKRGLEETFAQARETDISLIYLNCHGAYEDGAAYFRLHDDTRVTPGELHEMLEGIPGKIVLILDFCQSGAFIGAGGEWGEPRADETLFTSGRYIVIASAGADEDSYRRKFSSDGGEAGTAAIMGRSLCEAAGWDLIYDRSVAMKGDADGDGLLTIREIYEYTRQRVTHYLSGTAVRQTVYLFPDGDDTVLLGGAEGSASRP